jgi:tripartite-type tricarboxylate transporter receptor subunit TctC
VQGESSLGRLLWPLVLTGVVVVVVLSFARQPLSGGDGQAAGLARPVTLWLAGGKAGSLAEAVAQQAASCWAGDGQAAQVGHLPGSSSTAVAGFLTNAHDASEELLVITSTTLADIAHDRSVAAPSSEPGEHAQTATQLLAGAAPIAVLGSDPLALAVRANSPIHSDAQLLETMRAAGSRPLFGVAADAWLRDNLGALVGGSGVGRRLPYAVYGSSREAIVSLLGGEVEAVLAPTNALHAVHDGGRLRLLPWPSWSGGAPRAWVAIVGAPGLSAATVARLRARARDLCGGAGWTQLLRGDGLSPARLSAAGLAGFVSAGVGATTRLQRLAAPVVRDF